MGEIGVEISRQRMLKLDVRSDGDDIEVQIRENRRGGVGDQDAFILFRVADFAKAAGKTPEKCAAEASAPDKP